MQEIHTPKAGEGASVSRRKFMAFAAAGSAATLPAVALAEASGKTSRLPQSPVVDPIKIAVEEYEQGLAAFNALPTFTEDTDEDVAVEATYGPPLRRLQEWDGPALTKDGAIAALRCAVKEEEEFMGSFITIAMIRSALAWLEGGAA